MPATFAHPAFAWPLRRWLPRLALTVGAVIPDVAHLLPRRPWTDHTLLSLLTFSLPLGTVVYLLSAHALLPELARWAPAPWRAAARAEAESRAPLGRAVLGVLAGAATHVGLDHWTHVYGAGVAAVPHLRASVPLLSIPAFKLLQYGLGMAGSIYLAVVLARWDAKVRTEPLRWRLLWPYFAVAAVWIALAALEGHRQSYWLPMPVRLHDFLVVGAASGMVWVTLSLASFAALSGLIRRLHARKQRATL